MRLHPAHELLPHANHRYFPAALPHLSRTPANSATANFEYLYPELHSLHIVIAPRTIYIMSVVEDDRQVVVLQRGYWGALPGAAEWTLKNIYRQSVKEVVKELGRRREVELEQGRRRWVDDVVKGGVGRWDEKM